MRTNLASERAGLVTLSPWDGARHFYPNRHSCYKYLSIRPHGTTYPNGPGAAAPPASEFQRIKRWLKISGNNP
jgi:hypothetical protein